MKYLNYNTVKLLTQNIYNYHTYNTFNIPIKYIFYTYFVKITTFELRKRGFVFFLFYFHAKYLITLFYKIIKSKN